MGKKSKNRDRGFFSTDPDFEGFNLFGDDEDADELEPSDQKLRVYIEKKGRKGKPVTLVDGFEGSDEALSDLARKLKTRCGVGGSAKDGQIILQGVLRDKVIGILKDLGYPAR